MDALIVIGCILGVCVGLAILVSAAVTAYSVIYLVRRRRKMQREHEIMKSRVDARRKEFNKNWDMKL